MLPYFEPRRGRRGDCCDESSPLIDALWFGALVPARVEAPLSQLPRTVDGANRVFPCDSTELGPWGTQTTGSLSYNDSLDRYSYLWQTDRAWAGTCRQFMIALDDRTYHFANFRFTKSWRAPCRARTAHLRTSDRSTIDGA